MPNNLNRQNIYFNFIFAWFHGSWTLFMRTMKRGDWVSHLLRLSFSFDIINMDYSWYWIQYMNYVRELLGTGGGKSFAHNWYQGHDMIHSEERLNAITNPRTRIYIRNIFIQSGKNWWTVIFILSSLPELWLLLCHVSLGLVLINHLPSSPLSPLYKHRGGSTMISI